MNNSIIKPRGDPIRFFFGYFGQCPGFLRCFPCCVLPLSAVNAYAVLNLKLFPDLSGYRINKDILSVTFVILCIIVLKSKDFISAGFV